MRARVSVALQLLLCGLVLCTAAWGWATAEADFGSANPFLGAGGDFEDANDEAAAELEMRSERFRLEREATRAAAATQTATEVVAHLPSILFVETDSNANAATAATKTVAAAATATATTAATAATAPAPAANVPAPAVPAAAVAAPALVEADSKPKPSDKAPFMPGYDDNAPEPEAAKVSPLPPPAPVMSLDTLKMVAEHPIVPSKAAAAKADAATAEVADVTEDEAADLLEQVSAVIAGDLKARRSLSSAAHRFRALSAKQQSRRAAAAKAPGYGQPGVRDRHHRRGHGGRHHKRAARKHHRSHRRHSKRNEQDGEQEMPRFAVKTESDLVREARARAAALLGTPARDAATATAEADGANTAEAVRAKRNAYAKHSRALEEHLHRFMTSHHQNAAAADEKASASAAAAAQTGAEQHDDEAAEHEEGAELGAEEQAQAEADAEAEAAAELEAEAAAEAEAKVKAAAEAEAKAKADAAAKAVAAAKAAAADKAVLGARFAQQRMGVTARQRQRQRLRVGVNAAPGYGPPLHAPPDTHGSPPVMSSTVDLPLNRPPTPNYFYPPTANPPPAAIQTPRLPSLNPNPAPFAPQFPNADAYRSHQMNPYGQFQRVAPPMQREPAASLYPPYSSVPNFEPAAPRAGLEIEMPEPAGGAPSLVEWAAAVHRNTHYDASRAAQHQQTDRPITQFAGFSAPMAQAPQGF